MKRSLLFLEEPAERELLPNRDLLYKDLNLEPVFRAAAGKDAFLGQILRETLFSRHSPTREEAVLRQTLLRELLPREEQVAGLYDFLMSRIRDYEGLYSGTTPSFAREFPVRSKLANALALFRLLIEGANEAARSLAALAGQVLSPVFRAVAEEFGGLYGDIAQERSVLELVSAVNESGVMHLRAGLGNGLKPGGIELIVDSGVSADKRNKGKDLTGIAIQDQANQLRTGVLRKLLAVVNEVSAIVLRDLRQLAYGLGFYTACGRLYRALGVWGSPVAFPDLTDDRETLCFQGLIDLTLGLQNGRCPVGNSLDCGGKRLFLLSGANQGGKSTFLRSLGAALLMARCGMFVAAERFACRSFSILLTHFCHSEEGEMGRLETELSLLQSLLRHGDRDAILLMNESFSSTSEQAASQLADQVLTALYDAGVSVFFVTHFFRLADGFAKKELDGILFATASRDGAGARTFRIKEARPERTSYGMDIYREVFGIGERASAANR